MVLIVISSLEIANDDYTYARLLMKLKQQENRYLTMNTLLRLYLKSKRMNVVQYDNNGQLKRPN